MAAPRSYAPSNLDATSFAALEPHYRELLGRAIASADSLEQLRAARRVACDDELGGRADAAGLRGDGREVLRSHAIAHEDDVGGAAHEVRDGRVARVDMLAADDGPREQVRDPRERDRVEADAKRRACRGTTRLGTEFHGVVGGLIVEWPVVHSPAPLVSNRAQRFPLSGFHSAGTPPQVRHRDRRARGAHEAR